MPRSRFQSRHLRTTLSALTLACCVTVLPSIAAGAAAADDQPVLASMHAVVRSGPGVPVTVDVNLAAPAPATVHADGTITIPKDGIWFTTDALVAEPVPGTTISRVDVTAVNDLTGWIDSNSGEMVLQGDVIAYLSGIGVENCPIGPATVTLASTNPDGRAFDPNTASATLTTAPDFAIPAIAPGAVGCMDQEGWFNAALGLGVPGATSLLVDVQLTVPTPPPPPPTPPASGGTVTGSTDATAAPAPKPVPAKISTPPRASAKATARATATTTVAPATTVAPHQWPTDDSHDLSALGLAGSDTPTTFGRTPIAAGRPVPDEDADRTSLGLWVLVASLGGGIAGFLLLRSEARKMLRRRPHAAF